MDEEELIARLSIEDAMSDVMSHIANASLDMADKLEQSGATISSAFDNMSSDVTSAVDSLSSAASNYDRMAGSATNSTDHWTSAVGNYDKSLLEATHTTEQLVAEGYKTVDALFTEESAMSGVIASANALNERWKDSVNIHDELTASLEQANTTLAEYAESGNASAETMNDLGSAGQTAKSALEDLEAATNKVREAENSLDEAMGQYAEGVQSGSTDTSVLEAAQAQAAQAAANLSAAEENAKKAVEDYSDAAKEAGKSAEENSKKSESALELLAKTEIFKEMSSVILDVASAVYELTDAFSEAEKTVVTATGATDTALKGLENSMMSAYSNGSQDLGEVAGAIGEINTRMGLQGAKLTEVTEKFEDYSRITGSDVVGSVQNVTKVMNQWGVRAEDVESVLDKLAYAGQISGASVDDLSRSLTTGAASFQEAGLSLDNTIQLLADFELAGINSSTAIMGIRTAVTNFSKAGIDAREGLQSVIAEIQNAESSTEAMSTAVEVFGTRAGQQLALAIENGVVSADTFNSSLDKARGTLERTANASETLDEKWTTASNKIKASVTGTLEPAVGSASEFFAGMFDRIGGVLEKYPVLAKLLTGIAAGVVTLTAAMTGYVFVTNVAIPAITAFGTALKGAMGPIGWVSLAVGGLVTAITLLSSKTSSYNGTLEQCSGELDKTKNEYEAVVSSYGAQSDAAKQLSGQIETLTEQYEQGGGVAKDYADRMEESAKVLEEFKKGYKDQMDTIENTALTGQIAASQLQKLSEKSELTNADLKLMGDYANYLNDTFECDIKVNYKTGELTGFDPTNIDKQMKAGIKADKQTAAFAALNELDKKGIANAMEALNSYDLSMASGTNNKFGLVTSLFEKNSQENAKKALNDARNQLRDYRTQIEGAYRDIYDDESEVQKATEDYFNVIRDTYLSDTPIITGDVNDQLIDQAWQMQEAAGATAEEIEKAEDTARTALAGISEEVLNAAESYDTMYQSCSDSFEKQFGLFDEAKADADATVAKSQEALNSQLEYWSSYSSNLDILRGQSAEDLNLTKEQFESFVTYLSDGSPQAVGLVNDMVQNLQKGGKEGEAAVKQFAETYSKVAEERDKASQEAADWYSGFSKTVNESVKEVKDKINELEGLSSTSKTAGIKIVDSFASAIQNNTSKAVTAAQSLKDQVESVFKNMSITIPKVNTSGISPSGGTTAGTSGSLKSIEGNATGTTNSADVFIAGEEGPELIVGKGGSTVFPTSETEKILNAVGSLGHSETASLSMGSNFIPEKMNGLDGLTDRLESVFIPMLGKTVEIASDMISIASRDMNVPEREQTLVMPTENEYSFGEQQSSKTEKKITIEVQGSGSIEIEKGADKETMLEVLQENLKPVLMNIISSEIYEEGDDSYDY